MTKPSSHLPTPLAGLPELAPTGPPSAARMDESRPCLRVRRATRHRLPHLSDNSLNACNRSPGLQVVAGGSKGRSLPPSG